MRKTAILIIAFLCTLVCSAQVASDTTVVEDAVATTAADTIAPALAHDTLVFHNGDIVVCDIYEITGAEVKFHKPSNTKIAYVQSLYDINHINYSDGTVDYFVEEGQSDATEEEAAEAVNDEFYFRNLTRTEIGLLLKDNEAASDYWAKATRCRRASYSLYAVSAVSGLLILPVVLTDSKNMAQKTASLGTLAGAALISSLICHWYTEIYSDKAIGIYFNDLKTGKEKVRVAPATEGVGVVVEF